MIRVEKNIGYALDFGQGKPYLIFLLRKSKNNVENRHLLFIDYSFFHQNLRKEFFGRGKH